MRTRSMKFAALLAAMVVVVQIGPGGPAWAGACSRKGPQVTDKKGDATGVAPSRQGPQGHPPLGSSPLPSQASLDITKGYLTWNVTEKTITFTMQVADLKSGPPVGSLGEANRFYFDYGGITYELISWLWTPTTHDQRFGTEFWLTVADATEAINPQTALIGNLDGRYNTAKSQVQWVLPAAEFYSAAKDYAIGQGKSRPPAVVKGARFSNFEMHAQRFYGISVTLTADRALGTCSYLVGQEL